MDSFLWKIGGEAGFGIMTTGLSFSKIATRSGYHMFAYAEYPSLIRGGHNTYEVLVSKNKVTASKKVVDLLVCLNKDTYALHKNRLVKESMVVYDPEELQIEDDVVKIPVPFRELKRKNEIMQVMVNTIALGASLGLLGGDIDTFHTIIENEFKKKGQQVIDYNMKFASLGADYVKEHYPDKIKPVLAKFPEKEKVVMTGNEAFSFGCIAGDCRFYSAYPMTPSSTVLTVMAAWQEKTGMIARHAEDEISVINTALGSAHAGVRSAVGTSGGGFALMTEAISFAGIAEIPIVVFLSQRPGPATGMPTWTEQGDLLFAVNAGHGEFPKIVLAPGDIYEMITLTAQAFNLADIYQIPVIVMSDKVLSESYESHPKEEIDQFLKQYQPKRGKTVSQTAQPKYLRYKMETDGISERLIPGQKGIFYQSNSYEHIEDGHTTEEAQPRIDQVEKRTRKMHTYFHTHFVPPQVYGDIHQAKTVLVSWGGNKGTILQAQSYLKEENIHTAYIHFTHMYPLDVEKIKNYFVGEKRYILIENNSHGQFGKLLRAETGIEIQEKLLKYDGRPIFPEEIVEFVKKTQ